MMDKKPIHVRDAYESERLMLLDLIMMAYAEFGAIISPSYRENVTVTVTEETSVERIVAEQDGVIVGCVLLYLRQIPTDHSGDAANLALPEMRLLAVSPEMRGQGVATALINECIRRASHSGAHVLGLHTTKFMQSALRLYERIGFLRTPDVDFYDGEIQIMGYQLPLKASSQSSR
jgi:N-acetylglutamate synthase-like GNAT family acetyltransferase